MPQDVSFVERNSLQQCVIKFKFLSKRESRKKLLTGVVGPMLVVASSALFPVFADVSVYGVADGSLDNIKASGSKYNVPNTTPDKGARWRVTSNSSYIGFKSSTDLREGIQGLVQYQQFVDMANQASSGGIFTTGSDTFVGLSFTNIGTVKLGRYSTALRQLPGFVDLAPGAVGPQNNEAAINRTGLFTNDDGNLQGFQTRLGRALGFESVFWNGFSLFAVYGAPANKAPSDSSVPIDDTTYSLGLRYVRGPMEMRVATETRKDKDLLNVADGVVPTNKSRDTDTRAGIKYVFPSLTTLALGYEKMELKDNTVIGANKADFKKSGWQLGMMQQIAAHDFYFQYGKANNFSCTNADGSSCNFGVLGTGNDSSGAKQYVLGYNYNFTKQYMFKAYFSRIKNDARARYDFDNQGVGGNNPTTTGAGAGVGPGSSPTAFGVGVRYSFQ